MPVENPTPYNFVSTRGARKERLTVNLICVYIIYTDANDGIVLGVA